MTVDERNALAAALRAESHDAYREADRVLLEGDIQMARFLVGRANGMRNAAARVSEFVFAKEPA